MIFLGLLIGIGMGCFIGFRTAVHGQTTIEKQAIKNGCVKLDGCMYEIIPWKKEVKNDN